MRIKDKIKNVIYFILTLSILFLALVSISGCKQYSNVDDDHTISTQGSSELKVKPEIAEIVLGVSIVKDSAADAQSEVSSIINSIIDTLRSKGIYENDIMTEQLMVYEEFIWDDNYKNQRSVGWRATQTLSIRTNDFSKIGTIIDIAINNGANRVESITFKLTKEKENEYKKEALAEATRIAKEKAKVMAENSGYKLGELKTISESNFYYFPYRYDIATKNTDASNIASTIASTVLPREVSISATVNAVYYIK